MFGLILSSLSTPIFYIYEGFRWSQLTKWLKRLNRNRLSRIERKIQNAKESIDRIERDLRSGHVSEKEENRLNEEKDRFTDRRDLLEQDRDDYPLVNGAPIVERPTRLSNLIASYELYPESRYGVDGTFFWYHILNLSEDPARTEFQENVGKAESLVLISAAGALVGLAGLAFLLGMGVGALGEGYVFFRTATPVFLGWVELIAGFLIFVVSYHLALPAYRDAAESFRAMVDLGMPKFLDWLKAAPTTRPDGKKEILEENVRMYLGSLDSAED